MVAREFIPWLLGCLLLLATPPATAHDGHGESADTAFAAVWHHYEALWQTLAADSAASDFSLEQAGLSKDANAKEAASFFSDIAKSALLLGATPDLANAREIFYEISKSMVRLNELRAGERLRVVYCPMAKKSWLQREEKIVNPYHGSSMGGCGEIVSS